MLLSTCVLSIVLFVQLFNFVFILERAGYSARYCVNCSSLIWLCFDNHNIGAVTGICIGYLYRAQSVSLASIALKYVEEVNRRRSWLTQYSLTIKHHHRSSYVTMRSRKLKPFQQRCVDYSTLQYIVPSCNYNLLPYFKTYNY